MPYYSCFIQAVQISWKSILRFFRDSVSAYYPLYMEAEKQKNKQKDFILNISFYDSAMSFSRSKSLFVYLFTYLLGTFNINSTSKHRSWILTKIITIQMQLYVFSLHWWGKKIY